MIIENIILLNNYKYNLNVIFNSFIIEFQLIIKNYLFLNS